MAIVIVIFILFFLAAIGLAFLFLVGRFGDERTVPASPGSPYRPTDPVPGRTPISHAEFGERYFPECSQLAAELRALLAKQMGRSSERVLPEDLIQAGHVLDDSLDDVEYLMAIEDVYAIRIPEEESGSWRTFGDLVRGVDRVVRHEPESFR